VVVGEHTVNVVAEPLPGLTVKTTLDMLAPGPLSDAVALKLTACPTVPVDGTVRPVTLGVGIVDP